MRGFFEIEQEGWDDVLATSLRRPFLGIKSIGPHLRGRGNGRIVNIASDSAFRGRGVTEPATRRRRPGRASRLTRRAVAALADAGVTVNAVAPGTIDGETVRELAGDRTEELASDIPVGRLGRPEIAALGAWLLSGEAGFVNGATLLSDGGAAL